MSLNSILLELRKQGTPPLAVHVNGTVTYVIYGATTISSSTGYPVLRITEPSATQVYLDNGFLSEADRVAGSNGSAPGADVKVDYADAILLLTDPLLTYG
jgi:hypothetical protein